MIVVDNLKKLEWVKARLPSEFQTPVIEKMVSDELGAFIESVSGQASFEVGQSAAGFRKLLL